jgi:hypothetical protein
MAIVFEQEQLGSCSMGQFQQHHRGCEYGLVEQLDHRQPNQWRFVLERT